MIKPQQCIERILRDDPEVADHLYKLLLWMREAKGSRRGAEADEVMKRLYAETDHSAKHQRLFDRELLKTEGGKPESAGQSVN
jgi:hypothetical protein